MRDRWHLVLFAALATLWNVSGDSNLVINEVNDGGCVDKTWQCGFWSENGYCSRFAEYVSVICPVSCNKCTTQNVPISAPTTTTTPKPHVPPHSRPPAPIPANCLDISTSCVDWASNKDYYCKNFPQYMQATCPRMCNLCSKLTNSIVPPVSACRDRVSNCNDYADRCNDPGNEAQMKLYCASTCGFC